MREQRRIVEARDGPAILIYGRFRVRAVTLLWDDGREESASWCRLVVADDMDHEIGIGQIPCANGDVVLVSQQVRDSLRRQEIQMDVFRRGLQDLEASPETRRAYLINLEEWQGRYDLICSALRELQHGDQEGARQTE